VFQAVFLYFSFSKYIDACVYRIPNCIDLNFMGLSLLKVWCLSVLTLCISCNSPNQQKNVDLKIENQREFNKLSSPLTPVQDQALATLNQIQVEMRGGYLYSTFPNIEHGCCREDTGYVITAKELNLAIDELMQLRWEDVDPDKRLKLAQDASEAQTEYNVVHCTEERIALRNRGEESFLTKTGKWILPNVLNRRDIILKWD